MSQVENPSGMPQGVPLPPSEEFYLIKMFGDVVGELMCIRFKTTAEEGTKCGWPNCAASKERLYCDCTQAPWRECQLPEVEPAQTQGKRVADDLNSFTG